jgi:hypothetical protein
LHASAYHKLTEPVDERHDFTFNGRGPTVANFSQLIAAIRFGRRDIKLSSGMVFVPLAVPVESEFFVFLPLLVRQGNSLPSTSFADFEGKFEVKNLNERATIGFGFGGDMVAGGHNRPWPDADTKLLVETQAQCTGKKVGDLAQSAGEANDALHLGPRTSLANTTMQAVKGDTG